MFTWLLGFATYPIANASTSVCLTAWRSIPCYRYQCITWLPCVPWVTLGLPALALNPRFPQWTRNAMQTWVISSRCTGLGIRTARKHIALDWGTHQLINPNHLTRWKSYRQYKASSAPTSQTQHLSSQQFKYVARFSKESNKNNIWYIASETTDKLYTPKKTNPSTKPLT